MDFRALHKTCVGEKYVVNDYETKNDNKSNNHVIMRLANFSLIPHIS